MGIQFASVVISRHVDEGLVNETGNLNVVGRLDELHALKGSCRDETSTVARLSAPGNFLAFGITNGRVRLGGSPETEIYMSRY